MIHRKLETLILKRLDSYPALALLGARQCGKTTLAQTLGGIYFDMETEGDRLRLDLEWDRLIRGNDLIILDEVQTFPDIFPRIRSAIDRDRKRNGRFLLLGSVAPSLMQHVSESLAGRLGLVELHPFNIEEIGFGRMDQLWLYGSFPDGGILDTNTFPDWQNNYLSLLAQRDLPQWGLPAKPQMTDRLFRMLAAVHGGLWNASSLAKSLGINYQTLNSYLDYLEGAYLIRRLQPYSANLKKRLVKSPKVFWRDSGLLHSLLGVFSMEQLLNQPWVGTSWEGFVIEQIISSVHTSGRDIRFHHFRTSDHYEADLLLDNGRERWIIEIKLTAHPSSGDIQRLKKTAEMIGAEKAILLSRTNEPIEGERICSTNLPRMMALLDDLKRP